MQEYWIIHPYDGTIFCYILDQNGQYILRQQRPYLKGEVVSVQLFPGFDIDSNEIFPPEV